MVVNDVVWGDFHVSINHPSTMYQDQDWPDINGFNDGYISVVVVVLMMAGYNDYVTTGGFNDGYL